MDLLCNSLQARHRSPNQIHIFASFLRLVRSLARQSFSGGNWMQIPATALFLYRIRTPAFSFSFTRNRKLRTVLGENVQCWVGRCLARVSNPNRRRSRRQRQISKNNEFKMLENEFEKVINFDLVLTHLRMRRVLHVIGLHALTTWWLWAHSAATLAGDEWSVKLRKCVASQVATPTQPGCCTCAFCHSKCARKWRRKEQMFCYYPIELHFRLCTLFASP